MKTLPAPQPITPLPGPWEFCATCGIPVYNIAPVCLDCLNAEPWKDEPEATHPLNLGSVPEQYVGRHLTDRVWV